MLKHIKFSEGKSGYGFYMYIQEENAIIANCICHDIKDKT
jgi:hypothetical protein